MTSPSGGPPAASAIYVNFANPVLDLAWIPGDAEVIVVHNDDSLATADHPQLRHVRPGRNLGFGAGVNAALDVVSGPRVVIVNPDTRLQPAHWHRLVNEVGPDEVVTLPLVDDCGRPTSTVNRYPTPVALLLSGYRVGRVLRRGGVLRGWFAPLLGIWGREHEAATRLTAGRWSLADHWMSGAVFSVDTGRLRAVGGFDEAYFLYMEDVDLAARLARHHPGTSLVMAGPEPGVHRVRGSSRSKAGRRAAERHHLESVRRYARAQRGTSWRLVGAALTPRRLLLGGMRMPPSQVNGR